MAQKKPRLLIISAARAVGGGEVYLKALLPYLSKSYDVTVLAPHVLRKFVSQEVSSLHHFRAFPGWLEKVLTRNYQLKKLYYRLYFKRYFRRHNYDLISLQWFEGAVIEAITSRPLVLTMHTGFNISPKHNDYIRRVLGSVSRIICVSQDAQAQLVQRGLDPDLCSVVPNGVNLKDFTLKKPAGTFVTWIGRVEMADKNPLLFVKIAEESQRRGLPYQFKLVGDGSYLPTLKAYARSHQIDNLTLTGHLAKDQMPNIYADASLLCMTSTSEGLPFVMLEAMACGVPVVATNVGGVSEVITSSQEGAIVTKPQAATFLRAIDDMLHNPQKYEDLRQASRARIEKNFSEEAMAHGTLNVYDEVQT